MTPERWRHIKDLIERVLELPVAEREEFLGTACAGDESLYDEARRLLAAEERAGSFLEKPAMPLPVENTAEETRGFESKADMSPESLSVGDVFLDKYRIVRLLGSGGMGHVYQAKHAALDSMFAVKILKKRYSSEPQFVERFKREAQAAAKIEHPNIVRVFDHGVADSICYLIMEFMEGESLRTRLSRKKRFTKDEVLEFVEQVCPALNAVHEKGVVHRDLKPDNLFFHRYQDREIVKILDFGIAKLNAANSVSQTMTQAGTVFGTPHYMSPEQCLSMRVEERSDVYSLGAILHEMLSGRKLFDMDNPLSLMYAHVNMAPKPLTECAFDVSPAISGVVSRALQKQASLRPSANEFLELFRRAAQPAQSAAATGPTVPADRGLETSFSENVETLIDSADKIKPASPTPKRVREFNRPAWLVPAGVVLPALIFLAVLLNGSGWFRMRETPPPPNLKPIQTESTVLGPNFVLIPGGTVTLGRNGDECPPRSDCVIEADEKPSFTVSLPPFWLAKYEVTNKEYKDFLDATGHPRPKSWKNGDYQPQPADFPVTDVSWHDAVAYCEWRSKRDGVEYRLPTEAEWEFAARGTDARMYPWGNEFKPGLAHVNQIEEAQRKPISVSSPPSGTSDVSPFGIFGMAGNVAEWTASDFRPYPGNTYQPKGRDLECKIMRGGNFKVHPRGARTSIRIWNVPTFTDPAVGFRLAATPRG